MEGTFRFGSSGPAVLLMVDARALPGKKEELLEFLEEGPRHFRGASGMSIRLHWDEQDPCRFRAVFEYATEAEFERHDIRSRVDEGFLDYSSRLTGLLAGPPDVSVWRESSRQIADDLVRAYWGLVDAREWHGLRAILSEDITMEWPAFNERIVGVDNVIAVNVAAPENWVATVLWVVASGSDVSSATEVQLPNGSHWVLTTLWRIEGHRIRHASEYWCPCTASTEAPTWRRPFSEPIHAGAAGVER